MTPKNILHVLPGETASPGELLEVLTEINPQGHLRIERIVSPPCHASAPGHWYDQPTTEWVLLLQGSATLLFKDPEDSADLSPGDYVEIKPHLQHRIDRTHPTEPTIWLAIHWS